MAQDHDVIKTAFGPARREERLLANGATLTVNYSQSGRFTSFTLAAAEARVTYDYGRRVMMPRAFLEKAYAWEVVRQVSGQEQSSAVRVYPLKCGTGGRAPGYDEDYEIGELSLMFSYDLSDNLLSVDGVSWCALLEPSN
jgi:hypothetical protein